MYAPFFVLCRSLQAGLAAYTLYMLFEDEVISQMSWLEKQEFNTQYTREW